MNFTHLAAKLTDPGTVCLLVLMATSGFLLLRTQKRLTRQRIGEPMAAANITEFDSDPDEMDRWELEMHEKARAFSAQIDTKLALLQTLIAESHDAAARLEAALDREERLHAPASDADDSLGLALDQLDLAAFPMESTPATLPNDPSVKTGDRREEIYTLADYGFNAGEIARRIGRPRGEVELVLSLRVA